jgi:hypothetical protein
MIPSEESATFRDHAVVGCHMGHPPPPVKPAIAAPGADRAGGRLIAPAGETSQMLRCKSRRRQCSFRKLHHNSAMPVAAVEIIVYAD